MTGRLKQFITLLRLQTGATTAIAPVTGYILAVIATKGSIALVSLIDLILLFIIGIFIHIFLFVYNEVRDLEIDKLSPDLKKKPLVSGAISEKEGLAVVYSSLIITAVLVILFYFSFWPVLLIILLTILFYFSFWPVLLIILLTIFNALYDIVGKKVPGADLFIAIGIFLAVLFGASVVANEFERIIIIVGLLAFMQIMFNNSVEGGLKDVDHDHIGGARTIAGVSGLLVKQKTIKITPAFRSYAYFLKIIHISLLIFLLNTNILKESYAGKPLVIIVYFILILLIIAIFVSMHRFLNMTDFDRGKMLPLFSVHEICTYYLVPIALAPLIGILAAAVLMLIPLIWYISLNVILYGSPLQPRV
jgi:4-hydroxybenzoate polyprenyltransferase